MEFVFRGKIASECFFKIKKKFEVHLISILQKKKLKSAKVKSVSQGHTGSYRLAVEPELKSLDWKPCSLQADLSQHVYAPDG